MPSLIDIRRRIRSVKSTQQITKAMKMVAAAKLRRAQDRVVAARPYARILADLLASVTAAARASEALAGHPLLAAREEKRIQLVLITSDRGLAGAFNSNLIKATQWFFEGHPDCEIEIEAIGRKGRDFFRRRGYRLSGEHLGLTDKPAYKDVAAIAQKIIGRYSAGEIDALHLVYQEFKSVLSQRLTVSRLLPIAVPEGRAGLEYIYEQPPGRLLDALLPRYVEIGLLHAVLESSAAEQGARMTAMDAATSNASEMIDKLTLYMNRVRQASITREIIEVVSGAAALE